MYRGSGVESSTVQSRVSYSGWKALKKAFGAPVLGAPNKSYLELSEFYPVGP